MCVGVRLPPGLLKPWLPDVALAAGNIKYIVLKDLSFKLGVSFNLSFHVKFACWILYIVSPT